MAWENSERKERCDVGDVGLGGRGRHRGKKAYYQFQGLAGTLHQGECRQECHCVRMVWWKDMVDDSRMSMARSHSPPMVGTTSTMVNASTLPSRVTSTLSGWPLGLR